MEDYNAWFLIGVLGYLATWLLIPWVLLKPKVHASAAVAWILTIVFVPYLGGLLCLLIGTTRWERRSERNQEQNRAVGSAASRFARMACRAKWGNDREDGASWLLLAIARDKIRAF